MGANIEIIKSTDEFEPVGDIKVSYSKLHATTIGGDIIPTLIDELPLLAASTGSVSDSRRCATLITSSRTDRSAGSTSTSIPCTSDKSAAMASRRSWFRATSTRSVPRAASSLAKALPMPAVALF